MSKTIELSLSPAQQLVDINEKLTNFSADIHIESKTGAVFNALVLNEELLNRDGPSDKDTFQTAEKGSLDITVRNDNNIHSTWFLCLKSPADNIVSVTITKQALQPKGQVEEFKADQNQDVQEKPSKINWTIILIIIALVVIAGYFIYQYLIRPKTDTKSHLNPVSEDYLSRFDDLPEI